MKADDKGDAISEESKGFPESLIARFKVMLIFCYINTVFK